MFGKLENGKLVYAKSSYTTEKGNTIINFDDSENLMEMCGFKRIVFSEKPQIDYHTERLVETYTENDNTINVSYTVEKTMSLDTYKEMRIGETKSALAQYLEDNPLYSNCHNNTYAYYTCTQEKQSQFTSKYTGHIMLEQAGIQDTMTWNEQGKECEVWTNEECIKFIAELNAYVTSLVSKQQKLEVQIMACTTFEEVTAIDISYTPIVVPDTDSETPVAPANPEDAIEETPVVPEDTTTENTVEGE